MMQYLETLHGPYGQYFAVERELYRDKTEYQDLVIFENRIFGKVLALDGAVQTTTADNHAYHEMLLHPPLLAHGQAKRVLIIGGGDGGSLREAVKHPIERAVMVEIDPAVIELSQRYLPELSAGAFNNRKSEVVIADGCRYVAETEERFDVIVVDSTDPIGPGAVLFTSDFYRDCKRCLTPGGVLVTQHGVPRLQPDEVTDGYRKLSALFTDATFYLTVVPTYTGGAMTLGWASDDPALRQLPLATLEERFSALDGETRYYNPAVHQAAFALPPEVQRLLRRS
ncbi:polyamine aminopropyltransferase [Aquibaculum sediminis]|uniref:polyamine aminopropyltransferase n=1 Tax=Aquibaculum sediminis TaxID=3231907 RepID=UPI0034518F22